MSPPPPPPSLSSSDSAESTESSSIASLPRKIRFAPLPRSPSLNDDLPTSELVTVHPTPPPLTLPLPPLLPQQQQHPIPPHPPRHFSKKSWLKPFLRRPSLASSMPSSPWVSDSEPSSRPASINSEISVASSLSSNWNFPLARWASPAGSAKRLSHSSFSSSLTLTPTQSNAQSSSPTSNKPSRRNSTSQPRRHKGTRMLNGRIYGAPRPRTSPSDPNVNPFANARDEADPVFVEWGYGGMGSVHSAGGNGVWKRVQSGSVALGDGDSTSAHASEPIGMEESSGMGWVRKRREMKEKRERELREAQEKASAATDVVEPKVEPSTDVEEKRDEENATAPALPDHPELVDPPATSQKLPQEQASKGPTPGHTNERHHLQTVAIPAPPHTHRHTHTHTHSRSLSMTKSPAAPSSEPDVQQQHPVPTNAAGVLDLKEFRRSVNKLAANESSDDGVDEEGQSSSETEGDDEEDDLDDQETVEKALLALSAGLEKVSWHHNKT